ncbi:hypothetical protein MMC28_011765 [Mycoblastus sanguinarius]|nr:hypothetical protein [Mycoblastus sanguinarius]
MYATDIVEDFWEIGYDLFRDRDSMAARFVKADILDANSALKALHGKIDVMYAGSVLHLFNRAKQLEACRELVRLSKIGTAVLGCQLGRDDAEEVTSICGGNTVFFHNIESLRKMWHVVEEETGTRWTVDASLGSLEISGLEKEDVAWMRPGTDENHCLSRLYGSERVGENPRFAALRTSTRSPWVRDCDRASTCVPALMK